MNGSGRRPWVRRELPWLRSGPLFRVDVAALPQLGEFLDRFGYRRVELDGTRMTSRSAAHGEIARAFGFGAHYGKNWDAFHDCFGDYLAEHGDERPLAVLWRDLAVAAEAAPATTAEVAWALIEVHLETLPTGEGGRSGAVDVFVLGSGTDFDGP
jgi:RNAse (barnase) inhibitor barstar